MDNGSLQLRASVHKDRQQCKEMEGGGGAATITTGAVSSRRGVVGWGWWGVEILFSIAKLLLSHVKNIQGPCEPMLR